MTGYLGYLAAGEYAQTSGGWLPDDTVKIPYDGFAHYNFVGVSANYLDDSGWVSVALSDNS